MIGIVPSCFIICSCVMQKWLALVSNYQLNEKLAASLSADFAFLVNCLQKELEEVEETRTVSTICQEYVFQYLTKYRNLKDRDFSIGCLNPNSAHSISHYM